MTQLQDLSTALAGLVASSAPTSSLSNLTACVRAASSGGQGASSPSLVPDVALLRVDVLTCGSGWVPAPGAADFPVLSTATCCVTAPTTNWPMTAEHQHYLGHRSIVPTARYRRWRLIDSRDSGMTEVGRGRA